MKANGGLIRPANAVSRLAVGRRNVRHQENPRAPVVTAQAAFGYLLATNEGICASREGEGQLQQTDNPSANSPKGSAT
jgi:hypothetical protein